MDEQWRRDLRAARHNAGLTLEKLAERCGLSYEAVRGYENGRRRPTRKSLRKVLDALELSAADAALIIERAGFSPDQPIFSIASQPGYHFKLEELQPYIATLEWPAFVVDDGYRLIAVNRVAERLWGYRHAAELRKAPKDRRTLWSVASQHRFAEKIRNLEDVVRVAAARYKGGLGRGLSFERSPADVNVVLQSLNLPDQDRLKRMSQIYSRTKPAPPRVRWDYHIEWEAPDVGLMRFHVVVTPANEPTGYGFNDWIPVDAASWERLTRLTRPSR